MRRDLQAATQAPGACREGAITLAVYIAIGITGAAFGQSSTPVKTIKTVPVTATEADRTGRPGGITLAVYIAIGAMPAFRQSATHYSANLCLRQHMTAQILP